MNKGYILENSTIVLNKGLTELDLFVKDFISVLEKHSDYLVVGGYVSIATGRVRGTEDVDILVPIMAKKMFKELFEDLEKNNFWCYQGEEAEKVYEYIEEKSNIRFAKKNTMFPNIEFVPIDNGNRLQDYELKNSLKIRINNFEFKTALLEFQILYKELKLGSKKDIEDARHLRVFFKDILKEKNFKRFKEITKITDNGA